MAHTTVVTGVRLRLVPRLHYKQKGSLEDPWNILITNQLVFRWLTFAYILEWYR
ncbi:MAG: hypothetical protein M5R41_19410 [Bacteroidia bacterium]|nr:hypothetical protein [Bacteroidia bacterium]